MQSSLFLWFCNESTLLQKLCMISWTTTLHKQIVGRSGWEVGKQWGVGCKTAYDAWVLDVTMAHLRILCVWEGAVSKSAFDQFEGSLHAFKRKQKTHLTTEDLEQSCSQSLRSPTRMREGMAIWTNYERHIIACFFLFVDNMHAYTNLCLE